MAAEFEVVNARINFEVDSDDAINTIGSLDRDLNDLVKTTKTTTSNFSDMVDKLNLVGKGTPGFKNISADIKHLGQTLTFTTGELGSFSVKMKNSTAGIDTDKIKALTTSFNDVAESSVNFNRGFKDVASDVTNSFALMAAGGNKLVALKQIFFGLQETSGGLGGAFERVIGFTDRLGSSQTRVQKAMLATSRQMADATLASQTMLDQIKDVTKIESLGEIGKSSFNKLVTQIQNVTNEYQRLEREITSGSDISKELDRLDVEFRATGKEIETVRLILKGMGPEATALFDSFVSKVNSTTQATRLLRTQNEVNQKQQKTSLTTTGSFWDSLKTKILGVYSSASAADKQKVGSGLAKAGQDSIGIWTRLLNLFKLTPNSINQINTSTQNLGASVSKTKGLTDGLAFTLSSFTGGIIGGGLAMAIPAVFGALQDKLTSSIQAASWAQEAMSKFSVVFDSELDPALKMSDSLVQAVIVSMDEMAANLGRSKYELRDFAAGFQDTFVPMGFAREEAAKMSIAAVQLTEDLSSFYNITEKEASDRLSSYLVGNYENARKFGVQVNEAALNAELLSMGLTITTRDLDQQAKSMLALRLLYQGTTDAQGDALMTANSFANQLRTLSGNARDAAVEFGSKFLPTLEPLLAVFIRFSSEVGPQVAATFNSIFATISPLTDSLTSIISSGSIDEVFSTIVDIAAQGIGWLMDEMNTFIPLAADWAWNWGVEIYNGLIEVSYLIADAVWNIAQTMASMLQPGSPPEQGPLSTIDKWGVGIINTYLEGMSDANFDLVTKALDPIAKKFNEFGEEGLSAFRVVKNDLIALVAQMEDTGEINEELFSSITAAMPEGSEELTANLRSQLEGQKKLINLQKQADEAKSTLGFVPRDLQLQLEAAQAEIDHKEQTIDRIEKIAALDDSVYKKREKAEKAIGAAALGAANAQKAGLKAVQKTAQELYESQMEALNAKQLGEEEYAKERLRVEQSFQDNLVKEGILSGEVWDDNIVRIKEAQEAVDAFKKSGSGGDGAKGKLGLTDLGWNIEDFLPKKEDVAPVLNQLAIESVEGVQKSIETKLGEMQENISVSFIKLFTNAFADVKDYLSNLSGAALIPLSVVTAIISLPVVALIKSIGVSFLAALAPIGATLAPILTLLLALSAVSFVVYTVFKNWDSITQTLSDSFTALKEPLVNTIKNIKDFIAGFIEDDRMLTILESIKNIFILIADISLDALLIAFGALSNIISKILEYLGLGTSGMYDFKAAGQAFGATVVSALEKAESTLTVVKTVLDSIIDGTFGKSNKVKDALTGLFGETGPFGSFLAIILNIRDTFTAAFDQIINNSTVATDVGRLFSELWTSIKDLFLALKPILIGLGIIIGAVFGTVLIASISAVLAVFQAIGAVIPLLVQGFSGLVRGVTGVVEIFGGMFLILQSLVEAIRAIIFGGDFTAAGQLFQDGMAKIGTGLVDLFAGGLLAITNFGASILGFLVSLGVSIVANIAGLFGAEAFAESTRASLAAWTQWGYDLLNQVTTIVDQIMTIMTMGELSALIEGVVNGVLDWFIYLWDKLLGHSIIVDIVNDTIAWFAGLGPKLLTEIGTMTMQLVASFLQMGKDLLSGLLSGIGDGSITSKILGVVGGLFSGGTEEAPSDPNEFGNSTTAMQTQFTTFYNAVTLGITTLSLTWTTFLTNIQLLYTTMMFNRTLLETNFWLFMNTSLMNFLLAWTNFSVLLVSRLTLALVSLTEPVMVFSDMFMSMLYNINTSVMNVHASFLLLVDAIDTGTKDIISDTEDVMDIFESLIKVIDRITSSYGKMATAASNAAEAAKRANSAGGAQGPLDSYQTGTTYVPKTGPYTLHKGEVVLTPNDSSIFRTLLNALGKMKVSSNLGLSSLPTNMGSINNSVSTSSDKTANITINANYAQTQSPSKISDDLLLGLRMAGYGI